MKILHLIPRIMAVEPAVNWKGTKVVSSLFIYPFEQDFETKCLQACEDEKPDLVTMFAFGEGPYCPDPNKIRLIREKYPIVYIATDGACRGLWPVLKRFKDADCFSAIVNIDGSYDFPKGLIDLVTLTPLDQSRYHYVSYLRDRQFKLGFQGGEGAIGTTRRDTCDTLIAQGVLTRGTRNETWGSNDEYMQFMLGCRAIINFPQTGLGNLHVKARVLETGLAGALLLEEANSPVKHYFVPGEDYFEWTSIADILAHLDSSIELRQKMANSMRWKAVKLSDPDVWVERIMSIL